MRDDMSGWADQLPTLSESRIDAIEAALLAEIARERRSGTPEIERARRARRGRIWLGFSGAAAIVAVAAILAPSMPSILGVTTSGGVAEQAMSEPAPASGDSGGFTDLQGPTSGQVVSGANEEAETGFTDRPTDVAEPREVIATATATLVVDDVAQAAQEIQDLAEGSRGYVEGMRLGRAGGSGERDVPTEDAAMPAPSGAWISVRVPTSDLTTVTDALSRFGEVTQSAVDRRDVTSEAIDLRSRVDALEASVTRLTQLIDRAETTSELVDAESALTDRQAELQSARNQLKALDDQVAMSTLTVTLTEEAPAVTADPASFGDGVAAGWNGLLVALNGFVLALGFLLPWLALAAAILVFVIAMRRLRRLRKDERDSATEAV